MQIQHRVLEKDISVELIQTETGNKKIVNSRFGNINIDLENALYFPSGLLGMPDKQYFCLSDFPEKGNAQFKVLQSLNDINLSFVVLPVAIVNPLIDLEDIEEICKIMDVGTEVIAMLLIASLHETPEGKRISVNVRAPIIINTEEQAAAQYVFPSNKYKIRHMMSELGK